MNVNEACAKCGMPEMPENKLIGKFERNHIHCVLKLISEQTGLNLSLCEDFKGIMQFDGKSYFNIILPSRKGDCTVYQKLQRWADQYKLVSLMENGVRRIAVFPNF